MRRTWAKASNVFAPPFALSSAIRLAVNLAGNQSLLTPDIAGYAEENSEQWVQHAGWRERLRGEVVMADSNAQDERDKLERLFELIPSDGSPVGNITLLQKSELSEDEYWRIRNKLIEQGRIGKGKGKGGSVYRLEIEKATERPQGKRRRKRLENDIYGDFESWLSTFWVKDNNLTWHLVEKTAHQGGKYTGGKWTRPDFAIVAVNTYRYFPGKFLELVSFEVKPSLEEALAGVFECAAPLRLCNPIIFGSVPAERI